MDEDWLDERFNSKAKREQREKADAESRARGAVYARTAFNALYAQVKSDIERYKKRSGDAATQTSENAGVLAIHRGRFPAFHLDLHPPSPEPLETANVIQVEGYILENRETDKEYLGGVVEVLAGEGPDQYTLHYKGKSYTEDAPLSGDILGRIFDVLLR